MNSWVAIQPFNRLVLRTMTCDNFRSRFRSMYCIEPRSDDIALLKDAYPKFCRQLCSLMIDTFELFIFIFMPNHVHYLVYRLIWWMTMWSSGVKGEYLLQFGRYVDFEAFLWWQFNFQLLICSHACTGLQDYFTL